VLLFVRTFGGYCAYIAERRDKRLIVRVSESEAARVKSLSVAAGLRLSDFVRSRSLGEESGNRGGPSAAGGGDGAVGDSGRASSPAVPVKPSRRAAEPAVAPLAAVPRRNEGPYGCPTPLCQKRGAKGEPCPRHGVPMTFKL
jgi:hypothetical protein